jgi:hypothetical protein
MAQAGQQQLVIPGMQGSLSAFKPRKFNGRVDDALPWKRTFDRYSQIALIQGQQRCAAFGLLLEGPAEAWFDALTPAQRTTWDDLERAFQVKYVTAPGVVIQKQMSTMACTQSPTEAIADYLARLRPRMNELGYDAQLQLSVIIQNLRPEFKTYAVMGLPYADVDALQEKLIHCELSFQMAYAPLSSTPTVAAVTTVDGRVAEQLESIASKLENLTLTAQRPVQRFQRSTRPFRPFSGNSRRCFACNSTWHLISDCPQRQMQPQPSWTPRGRQFNRGGFRRSPMQRQPGTYSDRRQGNMSRP